MLLPIVNGRTFCYWIKKEIDVSKGKITYSRKCYKIVGNCYTIHSFSSLMFDGRHACANVNAVPDVAK